MRDESSRRGTLSCFRVGDCGALTLLNGQAAQVGVGSADIALGGGGRFIYALNSIEGTVSGWRIAEDASLTLITTVGGIPANIFGQLSAGMVAWDGPMGAPASFPSEMPPAPGMTGSGS